MVWRPSALNSEFKRTQASPSLLEALLISSILIALLIIIIQLLFHFWYYYKWNEVTYCFSFFANLPSFSSLSSHICFSLNAFWIWEEHISSKLKRFSTNPKGRARKAKSWDDGNLVNNDGWSSTRTQSWFHWNSYNKIDTI